MASVTFSADYFRSLKPVTKEQMQRLFPGSFLMRKEELRWVVCSENPAIRQLDELAENLFLISAIRARRGFQRASSDGRLWAGQGCDP